MKSDKVGVGMRLGKQARYTMEGNKGTMGHKERRGKGSIFDLWQQMIANSKVDTVMHAPCNYRLVQVFVTSEHLTFRFIGLLRYNEIEPSGTNYSCHMVGVVYETETE